MELKNLRTFQAVVDRGSYQRAAEALGYTQSTVTIHIQQLEEELGLPLFQRTGRRMVLTQTGERFLPQARELLLAADRLAQIGQEGREPSENVLEMTRAADKVGTGQITFAARDSDYDGYKIKEGELLGLENGKVSFTERDLKKAAIKLTKALLKKDSSFVTVLWGADVTEEQAADLEAGLREKLPDHVDLAFVNGGQPVYYLIISVE